MRTLESLYWYGVKLLQDPTSLFHIEKLYPYQSKSMVSLKESMQAVLDYMENHNLSVLSGDTEIFIFPGYKFMVCDALITNFHQPGSTLILLVAALIGDDWQNVYDHALQNHYRFLSYGDSSILFPKR